MTHEDSIKKPHAEVQGGPEEDPDIPTAEEIEKTRAWLEDGRRQAAQSPSPLWDMLLRAGEKTLKQMEADYQQHSEGRPADQPKEG